MTIIRPSRSPRNRLFVFFVVALLALLPGSFSAARAAPTTETVYLSGTDKDHTVPWDFFCTSGRGSGSWKTIPVPSNWETKGFGTYTAGWNAAPTEKGLYKHTFTPPDRWRGKRVTLVFEGAMTDTDVKINGVPAGPTHQGGFYRFQYDISPLLQWGKANLLEVGVSKDSADVSVNRAERLGDYWAFGGIYRPVYLEVRPAESIDRLAVDARADGTFSADIFLNGITTADTLTAQIRSLDGKAVGPEFSAKVTPGLAQQRLTATLPQPRLWTAETPNQYDVEVSLRRGRSEIHRIKERFGFRTIEVRPGDGIYVNGRKIILKGAARHSFWPDSGRTTSPTVSRADVLLMKEMNMNAVLTAHYPPDKHFLDACDALGLYVLDELGGWQKRYETAVGAPLLKEMVTFDVNHPSILFWCNANEGGWNPALDDHFERYDPQKRKVLHPWALFSGIQTDHYENYESTRQYVNGEKGNNIFMPTEFLHSLYDGGGAAGLNDYWNLMMSKPLGAGGFIWALLDEGLVRADHGGAIDVAGNNYPDGIVGPYREKEGSFFAIKDIWSPLQVPDGAAFEARFPSDFNGEIPLSNHFAFTDTGQCRFDWRLMVYPGPFSKKAGHTITAHGTADSPRIAPGASGTVRLVLPDNWHDADALALTALDPSGREIGAWVWKIKKPSDHRDRIVQTTGGAVTATEDASAITLTASGTEVTISKVSGQLVGIKRHGKTIALTNGPTFVSGLAGKAPSAPSTPSLSLPESAKLVRLTHAPDGAAAQIVEATYSGSLSSVRWRLHGSGWLELEYRYTLTGPQDFMGVSFRYPEKQVKGITWLGQGPYRVWKNRMRGVTTDVWSKAYNDTATGADTWKYPEFKGYYAGAYWAQLQTTEGTITVVTPDENLFLRLYTPRNGPDPRSAAAHFPAGDISFLDGVAPVGNKFHQPAATGPEGEPNAAHGEYRHTLYFYFGDLPNPPRS